MNTKFGPSTNLDGQIKVGQRYELEVHGYHTCSTSSTNFFYFSFQYVYNHEWVCFDKDGSNHYIPCPQIGKVSIPTAETTTTKVTFNLDFYFTTVTDWSDECRIYKAIIYYIPKSGTKWTDTHTFTQVAKGVKVSFSKKITVSANTASNPYYDYYYEIYSNSLSNQK